MHSELCFPPPLHALSKDAALLHSPSPIVQGTAERYSLRGERNMVMICLRPVGKNRTMHGVAANPSAVFIFVFDTLNINNPDRTRIICQYE
jgi:hypothetical protein